MRDDISNMVSKLESNKFSDADIDLLIGKFDLFVENILSCIQELQSIGKPEEVLALIFFFASIINAVSKDVLHVFLPSRKSDAAIKSGVLDGSQEVLLSLTGEIIDMQESVVKANGSADSAKEMLNLLVEGFDEDMPLLATAKKKGDWNAIQKIIHKQYGGACFCSVPRFSQIAMRLEKYLRSGKVEWRDALYEQVLDEMENIISNVKNMNFLK